MSVHEECGVFGIYSLKKSFLASDVYLGLFALQHRGQEAAGIAVNEDRLILYEDIFRSKRRPKRLEISAYRKFAKSPIT